MPQQHDGPNFTTRAHSRSLASFGPGLVWGAGVFLLLTLMQSLMLQSYNQEYRCRLVENDSLAVTYPLWLARDGDIHQGLLSVQKAPPTGCVKDTLILPFLTLNPSTLSSEIEITTTIGAMLVDPAGLAASDSLTFTLAGDPQTASSWIKSTLLEPESAEAEVYLNGRRAVVIQLELSSAQWWRRLLGLLAPASIAAGVAAFVVAELRRGDEERKKDNAEQKAERRQEEAERRQEEAERRQQKVTEQQRVIILALRPPLEGDYDLAKLQQAWELLDDNLEPWSELKEAMSLFAGAMRKQVEQHPVEQLLNKEQTGSFLEGIGKVKRYAREKFGDKAVLDEVESLANSVHAVAINAVDKAGNLETPSNARQDTFVKGFILNCSLPIMGSDSAEITRLAPDFDLIVAWLKGILRAQAWIEYCADSGQPGRDSFYQAVLLPVAAVLLPVKIEPEHTEKTKLLYVEHNKKTKLYVNALRKLIDSSDPTIQTRAEILFAAWNNKKRKLKLLDGDRPNPRELWPMEQEIHPGDANYDYQYQTLTRAESNDEMLKHAMGLIEQLMTTTPHLVSGHTYSGKTTPRLGLDDTLWDYQEQLRSLPVFFCLPTQALKGYTLEQHLTAMAVSTANHLFAALCIENVKWDELSAGRQQVVLDFFHTYGTRVPAGGACVFQPMLASDKMQIDENWQMTSSTTYRVLNRALVYKETVAQPGALVSASVIMQDIHRAARASGFTGGVFLLVDNLDKALVERYVTAVEYAEMLHPLLEAVGQLSEHSIYLKLFVPSVVECLMFQSATNDDWQLCDQKQVTPYFKADIRLFKHNSESDGRNIP